MSTDLERVRRLARVLVSDVAAYAGDEVRIGLEKDDLFDRVAPQLEQARSWFLYRVGAGVPDRERIFDHAIVDVLVYGNRGVATHIF